ncbi:MAG: hypothetical protein K0Q70_1499 [Rhodospirillales bacterium]|jgi:hypothetical protein|nr:hypothetical protein [Rhodospirillales bacterium]
MRLAVALLAGLLLAGCGTTSSDGTTSPDGTTSSDLTRESQYARGPLTFSRGAQADLALYQKSVRVGAFAVGRGGATWFYMLCPSEDCNVDEVIDDTLDVCNRRSRPQTCQIYAIGPKIVWRPDRISALANLRASEFVWSEPWFEATDQFSNVHVAGDRGIIARKQFRRATAGSGSGMGSERDFEKVQLTDGGTVFYEALTSNAVQFELGTSLADYVWPVHSGWLRKEHGIEFSAKDVRRRSLRDGEIAYIVGESKSGTCFVGDLVFKMPNAIRIDRHVEIALCRPASNWSKERLERYAFDLLAQFRFGPPNYIPLVGGS